MELLNVVRARSTWLFDLGELNPKGKSVFPELLEWLKDLYNFSKAPASATDLDETKALAFLGGTFQVREEIFIDVDLRIYNDGVIADTKSSTDDSDAILADVLKSAAMEFKLNYHPDALKRILYVSEINVTTPHSLERLNPKLNAVAAKISSALSELGVQPFELASIAFWPDQVTSSPVAHFRLERKLHVPYSHNRYYSIAPLATPKHLEVLSDIEKIASQKS